MAPTREEIFMKARALQPSRRSADIRLRIQTDCKKLMNENKRLGGGVFVTGAPRKAHAPKPWVFHTTLDSAISF